MVDAERAGAGPGGVSARGELEQFQWVSVGVAELDRDDAAGRRGQRDGAAPADRCRAGRDRPPPCRIRVVGYDREVLEDRVRRVGVGG